MTRNHPELTRNHAERVEACQPVYILRQAQDDYRQAQDDYRQAQHDSVAGFSMIELIVVLVIIAVLVAAGLPMLTRSQEQSYVDLAVAHLKAARSIENIYQLNNNGAYATLTVLAGYAGACGSPINPANQLLDPVIACPPANSAYTYAIQDPGPPVVPYPIRATRAAGVANPGCASITISDAGVVAGVGCQAYITFPPS